MYSKNQIGTIQIGPKATQLGAAYFQLECNQIFEDENDQVDHQVLFSDVQKQVPRSLIYSNKNQIEVLNYLQMSKIQEEKKKINESSSNFDPLNPIQSLLWKEDVKVMDYHKQEMSIGNKGLQEGEEMLIEQKKKELMKIDNPFFEYVKDCMPKQKYIQELYAHQENDFLAFTSGKQAFLSKSEDRDNVEDQFRLMLEENDYLRAFQLFADCDNGYGSFTSEMLNLIDDECPKRPKILIALSDRQKILEGTQSKVFQESVQAMNQLMVYTELRQKSSMLIPIDMSYVNQLPIFDQGRLQKSTFNQFSALSLLVSNITLPFRVKGSQDISQILNQIISYQELNIFGCISDVPLIKTDEQIQNEKMHLISYRQNMKYHKCSTINPYLFNANIPAFGESYCFRGQVKMPKDVKFECGFDMKVLSQIVATPNRFPPLLSKNIVDYYTPEKFQEDENGELIQVKKDLLSNLEAFPLHTLLLCHESFKYTIKNTINNYKTGDINAVLRFQEDDFSRDEISEVLYHSEQLYDDYSKHE